MLASTRFLHHEFEQAERMTFPFRGKCHTRSARLALLLVSLLRAIRSKFPESSSRTNAEGAKQSSVQGPPLRIPRQQAQTTAALDGRVSRCRLTGECAPVPQRCFTLRICSPVKLFSGVSSGEGVFRFPLAARTV